MAAGSPDKAGLMQFAGWKNVSNPAYKDRVFLLVKWLILTHLLQLGQKSSATEKQKAL